MKFQKIDQFNNRRPLRNNKLRRRWIASGLAGLLAATIGMNVFGDDDFVHGLDSQLKDANIPEEWKKDPQVLKTFAMIFYPGEMPDVLMQIILASSAVDGTITRQQFCTILDNVEKVYASKPKWKVAWDNHLKRFGELYTLFLGSPTCNNDPAKKQGIFGRIVSKNGTVDVYYNEKPDAKFTSYAKDGTRRNFVINGIDLGKEKHIIRKVGRDSAMAKDIIQKLKVTNNKVADLGIIKTKDKLSNYDQLSGDVQDLISFFEDNPEAKDSTGKPLFNYLVVTNPQKNGLLSVFDTKRQVTSVPGQTLFLRVNDKANLPSALKGFTEKGFSIMNVTVRGKKEGLVTIPLNLDASQAE